jgi:hypothetical protein
MDRMPAARGHECFHCKQWIPEGVDHDCWTTTEGALTKGLSEDLRDAWDRLRETAAEIGEQRIYASHHSIMFSRKACYFFVRPKRHRLEVVFFLDREVRSPQIRKVVESSRTKRAHLVHLVHRDQVEAPFTDWLREAYGLEDRTGGRSARKARPVKTAVRKPAKRARATAAAKRRSR